MPMLSEVSRKISPEDKTQPIVIRWALARLESAIERETPQCRIPPGDFFDARTLRWMLENCRRDLLVRAFEDIPPKLFEGVVDQMVQQWPSWRGQQLFFGGGIIARLRPHAFAALFQEHGRWEDLQLPERDRLLALLGNLSHLCRELL